MLRHLSFKNRLVAVAVPPLLILAAIAAYAVVLGVDGSADATELAADIRSLGAVALAAVLLSTLTVIVVGRSITDPVDELAEIAAELAEERLPLLIEALSSPSREVPELAPLQLDHRGEATARLAAALNGIQGALAQLVIEHQRSLRKGLSELVVNLARRNQSLLDRQIEYIDELESGEEDPKRLEELYSLDHLATRMRRNAESLLVVAGVEPPRRRGGPVLLSDVLRVALSEIEEYRNIELHNIDPDRVAAQPAIDLAHLMAELMENATQFSPPDQPVEVGGTAQDDGAYLISVVDHGIGIAAEQMEEANELLANPPDLQLDLSRSLGFMVIARLAKRLEVTVELAPTSGGGVTALVLLQPSLLVSSGQARTLGQSPEGAPDGGEATAAAEIVGASEPEPSDDDSWTPVLPVRGSPLTGAPSPVAPAEPVGGSDQTPFPEPVRAEAPPPEPAAHDEGPATAKPASKDRPDPASILAKLMGSSAEPAGGVARSDAPANLADAIPSGERFDSGVASLLSSEPGDGEPLVERTARGLVKRDRSRSHAPPHEGREIPGDQTKSVTVSSRSPEEIRQMLARYRDGKGRSGDAPSDETDGTPNSTSDSRAGESS